MPPKFMAPQFVKYDDTRDPCTHLHKFYRKMAPCGNNHPLLYQIFPVSLTGPTAKWYVRLEKTSSWREMANAFLEYYQFNTKIAPNCTVLQRIEKKSGESFREYAQRQLKLATQVLPPKMEDKMIKWFINNLKPPYHKKMISAQAKSLTPSLKILLVFLCEAIANQLHQSKGCFRVSHVLRFVQRSQPRTRIRALLVSHVLRFVH